MKQKRLSFRPMIRSRHPSHNILRTELPRMSFRSVIRLGSTTDLSDTVSNGGNRIEINTIEAVSNSASKLRMKRCFIEAGVKTADWFLLQDMDHGYSVLDSNKNLLGVVLGGGTDFELPYPIVAKHIYGSRGSGNTLIHTTEDLKSWITNKQLDQYIFEKYYNYSLEYRLHITEDGYFYTCRKALKSDTPEDKKWFRNDSNSVWFLETNELFQKPNSWNDIVSDCVKALKAVGADVLSFDVRVQSAKNNKGEDREYQDYILVECNSASSMDSDAESLSICAQKYLEELPKLLMRKYNKFKNQNV